jgi:hypothetical protein
MKSQNSDREERVGSVHVGQRQGAKTTKTITDIARQWEADREVACWASNREQITEGPKPGI